MHYPQGERDYHTGTSPFNNDRRAEGDEEGETEGEVMEGGDAGASGSGGVFGEACAVMVFSLENGSNLAQGHNFEEFRSLRGQTVLFGSLPTGLHCPVDQRPGWT